MPHNDDLTPEQRREIEKQHQQANWLLGGIIIVVCFAAGNAISMATTNRMFIVFGVSVGVIAAWAINRYVK
jgi:Na+-translocating ferredoxin:NAD+ oxidoreductase RnfD subunit